jgi:hypothetical protein
MRSQFVNLILKSTSVRLIRLFIKVGQIVIFALELGVVVSQLSIRFRLDWHFENIDTTHLMIGNQNKQKRKTGQEGVPLFLLQLWLLAVEHRGHQCHIDD